MLTISCPDGSVLGQFAADTQDAEILAKRVHETSADRSYSRRVLRRTRMAGVLPKGWHRAR
ncbi:MULTISPECIES: hypothetical protein [Streptomyces]|uniref:hypothetical protein n=1 Tax=Streptomyces lycopersici TaxID=2974589 RepID=UPI0021D3141A|nr:hypothetical protein [Streptomyces sp. NEAU-383]